MSRLHAKLSSRRWEHVRLRVFVRDGYRCQQCGKPGRLECHHVKALEHGGAAWDLDNMSTICRACHIKTHERPLTPDAARWKAFVDQLM